MRNKNIFQSLIISGLVSACYTNVNIYFSVDEKGKVYAPKITNNNIGYYIE